MMQANLSSGMPISAPTSTVPQQTAEPKASFTDVISSLVQEANEAQVATDTTLEKFMVGEAEVHELAMSVVKAELNFKFLLEVRNRLMDSYQEIMRMQI